MAVFDWESLLSQAEDDEYGLADQIRNYHLDHVANALIDQCKWVPFGVLGMTEPLESYEEVAADGALVADISKNPSDPPVLLVTNDYLQQMMDQATGNEPGTLARWLDRLTKPNARKLGVTLSQLEFTAG